MRKPDWLKLPFIEALSYLRAKTNVPVESYYQMEEGYHDWAFSVMSMTNASMLADTRELIDQAIEQGEDIETFKKKFRERIISKGWNADDRRMYTILDTNARRAHSAGRYEQMEDPTVKRLFPWRVWKHRDSPNPRPNHKALHNVAIAADHPFWDIATPSCAFGCRCQSFAVNERQIKAKGYRIENNPPNPETIAEPGFRKAPGSTREQERREMVGRTLDRLPQDIRSKVEADLRGKGLA